MSIGLVDLIAGVFKPAADLVDALHTSEDERLQAKARLLEVQAASMDKVLEVEGEALKARASIVEAEASSTHWLTATWRPITMLTFLALVVGDSLNWLPNRLSAEVWPLLQLGLGGYVVGRSVEKVADRIMKPKSE